jgi:crotonobetainyl-CoA:carnitine CoA-transferase CaiB-like acyl-CoA transferase
MCSDVGPDRPLARLRVVDFGQYIAGPAAAMLLADLGADVIRVDPPQGPRWNQPAHAILNRGKRSIALDLKDPADQASAQRLIASADVVIENFRPGVMARLNLGPDEMAQANPRLVYLSLPGFSSEDLARAQIPAWEGIIGAAVGQFTDMGLNRVLMGIHPSYSPLPLASSYAAVFGALAVTLALYARERDGIGDVIEVPIAAALLEGLAYNSMQIDPLPPRYRALREVEIEHRRATGAPLDLDYETVQRLLDPLYRSYRCADGRPFQSVCVSHHRHALDLLEVTGLREEAEAAGLPMFDPYLPSERWPDGADCTVFAHPLSRPWTEWLSRRLADAFAARSSAHWEEAFSRHGLPGAALRTTQEWLADAHALASGLVLELDDPDLGRMRQMGNVAWLASDGEQAMIKQPASRLDADRTAILTELEQWADAPEDVADRAAAPQRCARGEGWLDGVTIVDLTNVIAGPTIAATLSRFGAKVIKVDAPVPSFDPWNTVICGLQSNRGKQSLLADVRSSDGQTLLHRLLADADVITTNATDRQITALGLGHNSLRDINPELILCQLDTWGGPRRGPRSDALGYDDLVQAATGIMARFGGGLDTPEEQAHFGTIDVLGGLCGAFATAVALYKRARGGGADVARTSLAAAGQLIQSPYMYDHDGRSPFDEPSGRAVLGESPGYRCYEAADGWLFLACPPDRLSELARLPELEALAGPDDERAAEALLARVFATRPVEHWTAACHEIDIAAQRLETMRAARESNLADEVPASFQPHGPTIRFTRHSNHPSRRVVDLVAPTAIRPRRAAISLPTPAPKYGADSRTILAEHGYSPDEVQALMHAGVVGREWSEDYLPE